MFELYSRVGECQAKKCKSQTAAVERENKEFMKAYQKQKKTNPKTSSTNLYMKLMESKAYQDINTCSYQNCKKENTAYVKAMTKDRQQTCKKDKLPPACETATQIKKQNPKTLIELHNIMFKAYMNPKPATATAQKSQPRNRPKK
jgi:hypothetical protein